VARSLTAIFTNGSRFGHTIGDAYRQAGKSMPVRASAPRCLLAALAVSLLLIGAFAAAAQADPYGEIQRFGAGEIKLPVKDLGVDPETGSVYVAEQETQKRFVIRDFALVAGKYKDVAKAAFTAKDPYAAVGSDEVEGIAIDTKLKRLYILALERRAQEEPDEEVAAAGALYAFDTEPNGTKELEPAPGTTPEGVLVGEEALKPFSLESGVSLIEPSGIAVDPENDDVAILATVDRGKLNKPEIEEEPPVFEKETTVVVQSITSSGVLGPRYIDSREEEVGGKKEEVSYFHECGCATSPAFSPGGNLYVLGEQSEITAIPLPASSKVPPETVSITPTTEVRFALGCELECQFGSKLEPGLKEKLVELPEESLGVGGNLSISPEGSIWARARVVQSEGSKYGGALEFTSEFAEQGWTGGQSLGTEGGACTIDDLTEEKPAIAAGTGGTVFVLARAVEKRSPTYEVVPEVIEFGPNGSGCPHATATLGAKLGSSLVQEGESVPIVDSVTLVSTLTQTNSLGVEWEFGDGTKETISAREQQAIEIHHTFTKLGPVTIKEKIHTDDLATPTIEKEFKINIVGPPKVVTEEGVVEGTSVTLKGTVNPNGQEVTECKFEYGTADTYGSSAPCTPAPGKGEEPVEVSAHVTGLSSNTPYHFRLAAVNKHDETGDGTDKMFTTGSASKPATEAASSVEETTATLNAKVDPEGVKTECKFEYGPSTMYGSHVSCASAPGSGDSPVAVSAPLTGLTPGTVYHYRIVAESDGVPNYGEDKTFTTTNTAQEAKEAKELAERRVAEEEVVRAAQKAHEQEEATKHQAEEAAIKKKAEEEAAKKKAEEEAKAKTPTRAQLLAKALKTCAKQPKKKRAKCETTARKKYGSSTKKKKKKK
jgi:hypothetical protein